MSCETDLNFGSDSTRKAAIVNCSLSRNPVSEHFLVLMAQWQLVGGTMWLPAPIYARIPQICFLLGLLFFAGGLYLGFEYVLSYYYLGLGVLCCMYAVVIFLLRRRSRKDLHTAEQAPVGTEQAPSSAETGSGQTSKNVS